MIATEGPLDLAPPRAALAGALGALLVLVTLNPTGAEGDLHRALVLAAAAPLALLHAALRPRLDRGGPGPAARAPGRGALAAVALVLGVAALQLVPLPRGALAAAAPATAALHDALDACDGAAAPVARPASIEPAATARAALLGLAYAAAFLAARAVGRGGRAPANVLLGVAALGAVVGVGALFAQQAPTAAWGQRARWPFVNPNHLATFLAVSLGCALGGVLAPLPAGGLRDLADGRGARAASRRGLSALALPLIVLGLLRTQSRAGVAAAVLGAAAAPLLAGRSRLGLLAAAASVVVAFALVGGRAEDAAALQARVEAGLAAPDDLGGRRGNWAEALRVAAGRPWLGAGLGAYDDASMAVLDPGRSRTRPVKAHDDYLELAATVGWPAAALTVALLLGTVAACARGLARADARRRALGAGALAGALAALAHAVFDFGLQLPAVALLFATALGLACGLAAAEAPRPAAAHAPAAPAPPPDGPAPGPPPPAPPGLPTTPSGRWAVALAGPLPPPARTRPLAWARRLASGAAPGREVAALAALGLALAAAAAALVPQSLREADARGAAAALVAGEVREDLRAEVARRAAPVLAAADGALATAEVAFLRAHVTQAAGAPGAEVVTLARRAAEAAPGRARAQAQLALAELALVAEAAAVASRTPAEAEALATARARAAARLDLAARLGPTLGAVQLARGEWALVELARTGEARYADEARAFLGRALARDPALRRAVDAALRTRAARLGALGEALRADLLGR